MPKIFISHAHEDKDAAHQIAAALADAMLDPWLDVQELRVGDELLGRIANVLAAAEYFAIVLTRRAVTKPWVLTEMRMAVTSEIERQRPTVLVLRLDDCEVPLELRHKIYLDFRGRFDAALTELADHVKGAKPTVAPTKQALLAEMIRSAGAELWERLSAGGGGRDEWKQDEAASAVRELRSDELEGAVAISGLWIGNDKAWHSDLVKI